MRPRGGSGHGLNRGDVSWFLWSQNSGVGGRRWDKSQMLIFFSPKNAGKLRPCRAPGHTTSRSSTSLALVHALEVNEIRPLPRHVAGHGLCSCCSARVRWVGVTGIRETRSQKFFQSVVVRCQPHTAPLHSGTSDAVIHGGRQERRRRRIEGSITSFFSSAGAGHTPGTQSGSASGAGAFLLSPAHERGEGEGEGCARGVRRRGQAALRDAGQAGFGAQRRGRTRAEACRQDW